MKILDRRNYVSLTSCSLPWSMITFHYCYYSFLQSTYWPWNIETLSGSSYSFPFAILQLTEQQVMLTIFIHCAYGPTPAISSYVQISLKGQGNNRYQCNRCQCISKMTFLSPPRYVLCDKTVNSKQQAPRFWGYWIQQHLWPPWSGLGKTMCSHFHYLLNCHFS